MASGRYKHKIKIVEREDTQDRFGSVKYSNNVVAQPKANVQVISGTERVNAGVTIDSEFVSIRMRYDSRVKYSSFIHWKGREYIIRTIKPDDRSREMILTCSADIRDNG